MNGEIMTLETAKKIHKSKQDNHIDKNILEANIKLVDDNKILKMEIEVLKKNIQNTKDLLESLKVFWKKYTSDNLLELGQINHVLNVLDGKEDDEYEEVYK